VPDADAPQLYDLPEAGRLLFKDPVRLERDIRRGRAPGTFRAGAWRLPAAWVTAASGHSEADAEALTLYWRTVLAPPSPDARRAERDAAALGGRSLIDAPEAARRLCVDARALDRLDREGVVPSLRVDGERRYDEVLVALEARAREGVDVGEELDGRRRDVESLRRHEYVSAPAPEAPRASVIPAPTATAWRVPDGLFDRSEASPLLEADGFDVVDEP